MSAKLNTDKWSGISRLLENPSPFSNETGKLGIGEFEPGKDVLKSLQSSETKVLVVGAGGLGCEVSSSICYCCCCMNSSTQYYIYQKLCFNLQSGHL